MPDNGPRLPAGLTDLFAWEWRLTRRIRDLKTGGLGRFDGAARFLPQNGLLRFTESGQLRLGAVVTEASRDYDFHILAVDRFRVCFADGRLFHEAQVVGDTACVAHDCAPDLYRGRYRFQAADRWRLSWRITGPRKDLVVSSQFSRR